MTSIRLTKGFPLSPTTKFLIRAELMNYFKLNLVGYRATFITNYLKSSLNIDWSCMKFLNYMVNHLKTTSVNNEWIIYIDNYSVLPDTSYTLQSIARLIDMGNMELKGTHIITDAFNYVEKNMTKKLVKIIW